GASSSAYQHATGRLGHSARPPRAGCVIPPAKSRGWPSSTCCAAPTTACTAAGRPTSATLCALGQRDLARQRLRGFDDLLEGRSILEREGRHGDRAGAAPAVHVKAARLRVFGARAVAVDLARR